MKTYEGLLMALERLEQIIKKNKGISRSILSLMLTKDPITRLYYDDIISLVDTIYAVKYFNILKFY